VSPPKGRHDKRRLQAKDLEDPETDIKLDNDNESTEGIGAGKYAASHSASLSFRRQRHAVSRR
jgi:hypothetical protein